jgi:hypothetical protein
LMKSQQFKWLNLGVFCFFIIKFEINKYLNVKTNIWGTFQIILFKKLYIKYLYNFINQSTFIHIIKFVYFIRNIKYIYI